MKVSDYIADFFAKRNIDTVFGYIGGMITHLVDSIDRHPDVEFIQTYHEQTAAIAAEGYALESGKPGVAIATSGPGATNLMTGIADAYFGSVPVVFITGQVNTYEYKYNKPIRQQGFQETDVVSIVRPITKYAVMVDDAARIRYELEKAYYLAASGRMGPVLIDLPMDISRTEIDPEQIDGYNPPERSMTVIDFDEIKSVIEASKRPLLLIGGGCRDCSYEVTEFIRRVKLPFVTSLMGKGIVDEESPLYCGMIGSYGNRNANIIVSQSDLLIALGARLDTRQTGARISSFIPDSKIIQVDIDVNELENHRLQNRIPVNSGVKQFLSGFVESGIMMKIENRWLDWVDKINKHYGQSQEIDRFIKNKDPYKFIKIFNEVSIPHSTITADIGQNQMWCAQTLILKNDQKFMTSGGLAPMGFSLPAAIGAAFAAKDKTIYCFSGDGGFHMACQSLLLISQYNLNVKVIVLNNNSLGMITQFQQLYFDGRMAATTKAGGYLTPDIKAMAEAYGLPYVKLNSETLTDVVLNTDFKSHANSIIEYAIDGLTTVSPKLEYNQPIYNPTPFLPTEEIQNTILEIYSV